VADRISIEIAEDGEIIVTTQGISGKNHASADEEKERLAEALKEASALARKGGGAFLDSLPNGKGNVCRLATMLLINALCSTFADIEGEMGFELLMLGIRLERVAQAEKKAKGLEEKYDGFADFDVSKLPKTMIN